MQNKIKIIATIGPATDSEESLRKIKDKGVDFVRVNMSHSSIDYLKKIMLLSKKVGIPFIIDTEGSQIRSGELIGNSITFQENQEIKIHTEPIVGNQDKICLKPGHIVSQLEPGDLIYIDFDTLTLRVSDISTITEGYITAKAITSGVLGRNKAVSIDPASQKKFTLPTLSEKDYQSIQLGLEEGIGYIAASFMRSGAAVDEVRKATQNTMRIISKIECMDALENLNDIIKKTDFLLIDRGDLSREIPLEKIPFTQKIIINKAKKQNKGVFVATNLLETMIEKRKPTRAEIHDILNTIVDGASGLTLAAETAIGKYPMECINMLNKIIKHSQLIDLEEFDDKENKFVEKLEKANYLLDNGISSSLISPHGGKLINRVFKTQPASTQLNQLPKIKLTENQQMDVEQIAIGTYSPIEGFMNSNDFNSVLDNMLLSNGVVWPIPITLDTSKAEADKLTIGQEIVLTNEKNEFMAILHLEEKYTFDKEEMMQKMYGTNDEKHPGVKMIKAMHPILLGGKINLIKRRSTEHKEYELTAQQTRNLFGDRGWSKVVGFHTRNVIHRSHEFIQLKAMEQENCDGLFVHPIVGKKKLGDFKAKFIIKSYETMLEKFYPKNSVIFGTFSTYSRYAGPREALFTALCRQNFGCSHFIVGRDHTGVGNYYHPKASHNIFDRFPEIKIKAVRFDNIFYSKTKEEHLHEKEYPNHPENEKSYLSGTEARKLFEQGQTPPAWFMRPEIAQSILSALKNGEKVFVDEE